MNSKDLFIMALSNLLRRKTRSVLTILGVIIGTSSIVIMLSLGIAMERSFQEQLSYMGNLNMIEIYNYGGHQEPGMGSAPKQVKLDDEAVANLRRIPGVEAVMPVKTAHFKLGAGRYVGYVSVIGIDPTIMEAFDFKVEQGRLLSTTDKDAIVFGRHVSYNLYNPRLRNQQYGGWGANRSSVDLMSSKLVITSDWSYGEPRNRMERTQGPTPKLYDVKAVGILAESFSEKDYNAYMNITALEKILEEEKRNSRSDRSSRPVNRNESKYERISVKVGDIKNVEQVQETIKSMGFQAFSLIDMVKSMKDTAKKLQAILGGIGAVSLLVAAIGITNTMIMSIYERTREIGVMKVLGANLKDIRLLFLLEAALIGLCGGLLGLVTSYSISFGLNKIGSGFMGPGGGATGISVIPPELAVAAVIFATCIGIISGYSPAKRAMNLSALEAIRSDK